MYPFKEMAIGDSFSVAVPEGKGIKQLQGIISGAAHAFGKSRAGQGRRFITRRVDDGRAVRVWRIADKTSLLDERTPRVAPTVKPRVFRMRDDD